MREPVTKFEKSLVGLLSLYGINVDIQDRQRRGLTHTLDTVHLARRLAALARLLSEDPDRFNYAYNTEDAKFILFLLDIYFELEAAENAALPWEGTSDG